MTERSYTASQQVERDTVIQNRAPEPAERIAANLAYVRSNITEATGRVGRQPEEVTLVAVSKTKPLALVEIAYTLGVTDFGENRVQEALPKITDFSPRGEYPERSNIRWHMIGHLQSNKVGKVVGSFDCVQSVDSLHLAQALSRHASENGVRLPILLEVNVAAEQSKAGMTLAETPVLARQIVALPSLEVQGLMTVAPQVQHPEEVRPVFRELRHLRNRLRAEVPGSSWQHLSMGMTDDYIVAIEEGATIVRIGRAIFGERVL